MNPSDANSRIRCHFDAASVMGPVERAAYLARECANDPEVLAKVEHLLRVFDESGDFLSQPSVANRHASVRVNTDTAPLGAIAEGPGSRVGPYKILQLIGEGGFGSVFLAEQEHPIRRRVALKIIKLGMDTKQVIARFEAERQALALMDHPNIAKVLDAGATPTGGPYFVMELVRGVPMTEYCDVNNLSTRERLGLFILVCRAMQHAHQKGVIHRDIKPNNILITLHDGTPVPKIIDFGIAKATNQRLTEKTMFTEFRQFVGTPEYMSPEQAEMSGLDVDTRSDVYSLGVLLYELLTGTTPFDSQTLRSAGYAEIQRIIREVEPPRPSTRISTLGDGLASIAARRRIEGHKLGSLVRGDLDWLVMKCLEKDRTRRYDSASALADDAERYLADQPVVATPPSVRYKVGKFIRRNRSEVLIAGTIALVLAAGATAGTLALREAHRSRELAMEAHQLKVLLENEKDTEGGYREPLEDRTVRALLATRRVSLDIGSQVPGSLAPLESALAEWSRQSRVVAHIDWDALEQIGVLRNSPIRLKLESVSAEAALSAMLASSGKLDRAPWDRPQFFIQDGAVAVTTEEAARKLTMKIVYRIDDLLGTDPEQKKDRTSALKSIISGQIDPEGWRENGGDTGIMQVFEGTVIITNTRDAHRQIALLLRRIREGGLKTDQDLGADSPAVSRSVAGALDPERAVLDKLAAAKMTANWYNTPLSRVLDDMAGRAGIIINVDWQELERIGITQTTPVSLSQSACSLATLLDIILPQLRTSRNVWERPVIECLETGLLLTSGEQRTRLTKFCMYDINPLLATESPGTSKEKRIEHLQAAMMTVVEPDGWAHRGGDEAFLQDFDGRWLIKAPAATHIRLRAFFASVRAPRSVMSDDARP